MSALLPAALALPAAASITGVCPDGSIYVVQSEAQVPCPHSKQVEPHEVPPVRPSYLPKPYTWQVWSDQNDPNNPYNLIDQAKKVRELGAGEVPQAPGASPPSGRSAGAAEASAASAPVAAPARAIGPLDLGLSEQDLTDLFAIVDLSQERAPARFERETAGGEGVSRVAFARSRAFEERLHAAWEPRGGLAGNQVLLFTARSNRPQEFYPNFTFVQAQMTFQPDAAAERQLGVLQGHLGPLDQGEVVLGYVVLPDTLDLAQAMDIYWDDRHTRAEFGG